MTQATALVGMLSYGWPGMPGTPAIAQIELPREDYDPLLRRVGIPISPDGPSVALVACRRPVHPLTHVAVLVHAFARDLADLLEAGAPRPDPVLLVELDRLATAVDRTVTRWEGELRSAPPKAP